MTLTSLKLNKFDPRVMEKRRRDGNPSTCIFIGKRGSGKTTLVMDIMYYHRTVPYGVIMSGTEEANSSYSQYFPSLFIHGEFKKDVLEKLINRQRKVLKDQSMNPHAFLLIDDLMYDRSMIRNKNMRLIFMNGRHWKLLFMLSMQYCVDLPPDLRANVDYVFVLRENIVDNQKKLWKMFFGIFPTFTEFQQTLLSCTENYECLVIDNTSKSNKIEDCVYWYKATPNRKYKIGCKELWEYASKHFDDNFDNSDEDSKPARKQTVVVKKKGIKE